MPKPFGLHASKTSEVHELLRSCVKEPRSEAFAKPSEVVKKRRKTSVLNLSKRILLGGMFTPKIGEIWGRFPTTNFK